MKTFSNLLRIPITIVQGKNILIACLLVLSFIACPIALAASPAAMVNGDNEVTKPEEYEGCWSEKAPGQFIISVTPMMEPGWYDVTIANRRKLTKMDVYMMQAHYQKDGSLYYEKCLYVVQKLKANGTVKDKIKYRNGSGLLYYSLDENVLYWTDYTLKPEKNVRTFVKAVLQETDEM